MESGFAWGLPQNDVEAGLQFAGFGVLDGTEGDKDRFATFIATDAAEDAVAVVLFVAFDVALGRELIGSGNFDFEVDMRRAAGIGDGFDRAEVVAAVFAREESAESLKVGVALGVAVGRVEIAAIAIDLPDFDQCAADRVALGVEYFAGKVRHFADGGGDVVVDDEQIVVGVEGEFVGVERPLSLARGECEGFGEGTGGVEERGEGSCGDQFEEPTPCGFGFVMHVVRPLGIVCV